MSEATDDFVHMWEWFATHCEGYSPLYADVSRAVAKDRELLEMVRSAPPDAHLPPALLAAVHYVLLDGLEHPLNDVYAGRAGGDPGPLFLDVCRARKDDVMSLLSTRHIQTNDCGRSALIGPGLTWLSSYFAQPLALVDVGASAGINLLCDRFLIDYGSHGSTGPADSPVHIECEVLGGDPPIAAQLPKLVARVGIDRSPIDVTNAEDARWLLACVWPDTGRLERAAASIRMAQEDPPVVVAGDANEALPGVLDGLPVGAAAVVVTTWAFAYLTVEDRRRFVEALSLASRHRPVAWLSAESAGTVEQFSGSPIPGFETADVLGMILFSDGTSRQELLAHV